MNNPQAEPFIPPIVSVRGLRVVLDVDAAQLYQVGIEVLQRMVEEELARFPDDFMITLMPAEQKRFGPGRNAKVKYAFFPEGIAMLASVLNSPLAINGNVNMTRAFVYLDRMSACGQTN